MAWEYIGDILRLTVLGGLGAAGILTVLLWKKNLATKVTFLRLVVQAVAFAALFYVFSLKLPFLYFFIFIFAITLFLGRFYCGWLCPFGFVMDIEVMLRKSLEKSFNRFERIDIKRMKDLAVAFPGSALIFATLKSELGESEQKLIRNLAIAERKKRLRQNRAAP